MFSLEIAKERPLLTFVKQPKIIVELKFYQNSKKHAILLKVKLINYWTNWKKKKKKLRNLKLKENKRNG